MTPEAARALLDVPADAAREDIELAFRLRSRMMHPDRFAGRPESEVKLATIDFQRLERAYRLLLDGLEETPPRQESSHPGADLRITHLVSSERLSVGGIERVSTPHGMRAIRIPPHTHDRATVRAAGSGAPGTGPFGGPGDLYVLLVASEPTPHPEPPSDATIASLPASGPSRAGRAIGWLLGIGAVVTVFAFATAHHWTITDVPEQLETFHPEEYRTGSYIVKDDGVPPCRIGQDWTDCTNAHIREYNDACVGHPLTAASSTLCSSYSDMIDEMQAEDQAGWEVRTLGDYGRLSMSEEVASRQVSNGDHRPAVTREVVCYLGFLGECP